MNILRRRSSEVILPNKVAEEVRMPPHQKSPLAGFIGHYPHVVEQFSAAEEGVYLRVRGQPGINDGEAAAIALALSRRLPLVIDDKKGRDKARNHGITCLGWREFVQGK